MALTVVLGSHAPASAASAGPADDADPGASAVLAPRDPGLWWIKNNGLAVRNGLFDVNLMQVPANLNPLLVKVLWHFTPVPGKTSTYYVENHNGGCLDIADGISTTPGLGLDVNACDGTRSQQWYTPSQGGDRYRMTNDWSGLAATVNGSTAGATLYQTQSVANDAQQIFNMPFFGWE
jgi:hypothetical protein